MPTTMITLIYDRNTITNPLVVPRDGVYHHVRIDYGETILTDYYARWEGRKLCFYTLRDERYFPLPNRRFMLCMTMKKALKLYSLSTRTIRHKTIHFLNNMCPGFREIRKMINRDEVEVVKRNGIDFAIPKVEEEERYRLIKGPMQSGKTWAIISLSIYYIMMFRISVVIVVQNGLDAQQQIETRIKDAIKSYREYMRQEGVDLPFYPVLYPHSEIKKMSPRKLTRCISGFAPGIHVVLRNSRALDATSGNIKKVKTPNFVTVIDESDFNDSGTSTKVQSSIDKLKDQGHLVYDVTATPLTSMVKEKITLGNLVILPHGPDYKGVLQTDFVSLEKPAEYCSQNEVNPFKKDPNLKGYLRSLARKEVIDCISKWGKEEVHPVISLIRVGSTIKSQKKIAKWIHNKLGTKIITITYNGSGEGITMRGNNLPNERITLLDGNRSRYTEGVHHFRGGVHVSLSIAYLQENGGVERYPRIAILAGCKADRGISFGTANWETCKEREIIPWHLTEMYMVVSKNMSQPNLLQTAGRLFGVYPDNIRLTLYSNEKRDTVASYLLQEELTDRIVKETEESESDCSRTTSDVINDSVLSEEKKVKRDMTSRYVKNKCKPQFIPGEDGGWQWENISNVYAQCLREERTRSAPTVCRGEGRYFYCTRSMINTRTRRKVYDYAESVLFNLNQQRGNRWHLRTTVIDEILEEDCPGRWTGESLRGNFSHIISWCCNKTNDQYKTDCIVFKQVNEDRWYMRYNV